MSITSTINPMLTLDYIKNEHENKYFDRKSAKIRPAELAPLISAFANADGGTIVLGISDTKRELEGIALAGEERINDFLNAPRDCCKPMPNYQEEYLEIINEKGKPDRLLLLHISGSKEGIIRTYNDETWLRIGDRTKQMLGENLRNLEYAKNARRYEDELHPDAQIEDLDVELLAKFKSCIGAEHLSDEQVLKARHFLKTVNGEQRLTNAAVLLFAKDIQALYPNCRVRFIRYDGTTAGVGTSINITKDVSIEYSLLRLIDKAKEFIATQLREFTKLNPKTGKFDVIPEYPEFPWLEGITNAICHREYAMTGAFIKVCMFDDRLEISSPGQLPGVVTLDNIRETRFSRNPVISRVLTECKWVRELNEGVPRIYDDMKEFSLDEPTFSETPGYFKLVLRNNIVARQLLQGKYVEQKRELRYEQLDDLERQIMLCLSKNGIMSKKQIAEYVGKSQGIVQYRLKKLISLNLVQSNGNEHDPRRTYGIIP